MVHQVGLGTGVNALGQGVQQVQIVDFMDLFVGAVDPRYSTATGVVAQSANAVHYVSFQVRRIETVSTVYFRVGVASGNVDMGLYEVDDTTATLLGSTGSFAVPTAAVKCSQALTGSATMEPGHKYIQALAADNTTAGFGGLTAAAMPYTGDNRVDIGIISTSFPLPATLDLTDAADTGKMFCLQFA